MAATQGTKPDKSTDDLPPQPQGAVDGCSSGEQHDLQLVLHHHGQPVEFSFPHDASISNLSERVENELSIPPSNQKFMVTPKTGLLRPPFKDPTLPLSSLVSKKIVLMGSTISEISSLNTEISRASAIANRRPDSGPIKPAAPARTRDWKRVKDDATYTFHTLRPLAYLPNSERSLRFLERLRDDPGIKAAMRAHQFSVSLLTEMDPAMHTTHESRTLGLNRNRGEVIELRLRTDAYDGYRDYKTIRKTLCHELAHNLWGEHDRNFWDLCKQIEREVEKADWTRGGRTVGHEEFYNPDDDMLGQEIVDHGGWQGGEFILGGSSTSSGESANAGLSRREIIARAAEERMKKAKEVEKQQQDGLSSDPSGEDSH